MIKFEWRWLLLLLLDLFYYLFSILLGYGIFRLIQRYIQWMFTPLWKLPGPNKKQKTIGSFWIGNFFEIRKEPFMEPHKRWWKEVGYNVPMIHYTGILGSSTIVVLKKELIKEILTSPYGKEESTLRFMKIIVFVKNLIGNGLVCVEGQEWMDHRQIIQPAFHTKFLKDSLWEHVPSRVNQLIQIWNQLSINNNNKKKTMEETKQEKEKTETKEQDDSSIAGRKMIEIHLASHLSALTLDIIGDVAFSHDFHGVECIQRWAEKKISHSCFRCSDKKDDETTTTIDTATTTTIDTNNNNNNNNTIDNDNDDDNDMIEPIDDPFMKALSEMAQFTAIGTFFFILGSGWLDRNFNPRRKRINRHLDRAVHQIVQNAKHQNHHHQQQQQPKQEEPSSSSSSSSSKSKSKSLLQLLLQANNDNNNNNTDNKNNKKALNDQELCDETKTFMIAGHETTATLCYWAIYALMKNPSIQERIYQEILQHLEKQQQQQQSQQQQQQLQQQQLDLKTIEEMEYFHAFLQEVNRLYPPVGMIVRRMNRKGDTLDGYSIPRGTRIVIPIHLLHRHPMYWKHPNEFQPERWIFQNATEREQFLQQTRFAYLPFSLGGRNCIGQKFAMMEAKLILSSLIQNFIFHTAPSQKNTNFVFTNVITMKMKPALKVCIEARK